MSQTTVSQTPAATCCTLPHPIGLRGDGETELVAALRSGCPEAARLLVGAILSRLDALQPGLAAGELPGACWLALAGWPATSAPLVERVADSLLVQLRREDSLAALPRVDELFPEAPTGPRASAVITRGERLGLLTSDESGLLREVFLLDDDARTVARRRGISPGLVRTRCHRLLKGLRGHAELLTSTDATTGSPRTWPGAQKCPTA